MLQSNAQLIEVQDNNHAETALDHLEVVDTGEESLMDILKLDFMPGAPGTKEDFSNDLVVTDHDESDDLVVTDENDAKPKKNDKWDWSSKGPDGFVEWIKERFSAVPKHNGKDKTGLERAHAYLEKLDNEISKAMKRDLESELDFNKVEAVRAQIEDGISRLEERLDLIVKSKKKKKASFDDEALIKQAQKITGVQGTFVCVSLLISSLGRTIINGTVSAGHSTADMFQKLAKKYKLTDREELELVQYLSDSGFPVRVDRGTLGEEFDERSSNNYDYSGHFQA